MKFNFDLKKAPVYLAIKWEKFPIFKWARPLKKIFSAAFIVILILFLYGFLFERFSLRANQQLLGFSTVALVLHIAFSCITGFVNSKLRNPQRYLPQIAIDQAAADPANHNLAEFLSFEVAKGVDGALTFTKSRGVDSSQIFYFLLSNNQKLRFVFQRALLDIDEIQGILKEKIKSTDYSQCAEAFTENFQSIVLDSLESAQKKKRARIELGDIMAVLAKKDETFREVLIDAKLKPEDMENLIAWVESVEERLARRKKFWEYENLARNGTLAKEWTAGYTITLDRFSKDITATIKGNTPEFIAHRPQVEMVERVLARREVNNVLIVGEPGAGRKSIIYSVAQRSLLGRSLAEVNYKRVVQLDMTSLLAQIQDPELLESALDKVFSEAVSAGNVVLVIDDFHDYIGQSQRPGAIDIGGAIVPYLRLPNFQIICITNYDGFHRSIEKNASILSLFEKIEVPEFSKEDALMVLETLVPTLERKYKIWISYPALRDIVELTSRYLPVLSFPEKAINILDEAVVQLASANQGKILLPKHIAKIITQKTEIPVGEMDEKEKQTLLNLEALIHQRIINQEEAVNDVATAMRRARSEITIRKGPIGCFLFLGPTGVGKTETSKALAEFYFGSETRMIRLDMSEFQEINDIARLIGGKGEIGLLVSPARENPFSLLLLDEIEKAHPNILNLFLQVLDEGFLTDGFGKKVDFKNTIIIATSNAGYQIILEAIKQQSDWSGVKQKILEYLFNERTFRPEFINRFDAVVVFKPLSKENLLGISELMLQNLRKNLKEKGIDFTITEPLKEKIVELGYNPIFGAREMRRVIQDKVENVLASALLSGQISKGKKISMDPDGFEIIINQ